MKKISIRLLFLLLWFIGAECAYSQLIVVDTFNNSNINNLAQSLVGAGVSIFNVQYQCSNSGLGIFNGVSSNIGLNEGIVLTSGNATDAIGPNNDSGAGIGLGLPGDSQLNLLSSAITNDACVLEFDFRPDGDTIKFNYVFGSEEYLEYVNAGFNDIFAFIISGPGITTQNIALIPGTSSPVSIDNVNNIQNSQYYYNNEIPPGQTVQYDGFTTVLTAKVAVIPCDTYHLKLAVADAGDDILDSGVFIEKGSLSSRDITLSTRTNSSFFSSIVESCLDGSFEFVRRGDISDSLIIHFDIAGSATNGIDYNMIPDSIIFLPNDSISVIDIKLIDDTIIDDNEDIKVYLIATCTGLPYDSAVLKVKEPFSPDIALPDSVICIGDSIMLNNINDTLFNYSWQPNTSIDCDTCAAPVAFPVSTTLYTVSVSHIPGCSFSDSVLINVNDIPNVFLGNDISVCQGESVTLNPIGDTSLTWSWINPNGLSCTQCSSPIATPNNTNTYIAQAFNGNCTASDTMVFTVLSLPPTFAGNDQSICLNDSLVLSASGGDSLFWSPSTFLTDTTGDSIIAFPNTNITYTVVGVDTSTGCTNSDSVNITVFPLPVAVVKNDTSLCSGDSVLIGGPQVSGNTYLWSPTNNIINSSSPDPLFKLNTDKDTLLKYVLTVTSSDGCISKDSVQVTVHPKPIANAGNDTVILKGSSITLNGMSGDTYSWSPVDFLSKTNVFNPVSSPDHSITYTLTVSTVYSCWDTSDIYIRVFERPAVFPQAFSPNGDGENDFIGAYGVELNNFNLLIFNRWGKKVFETNNVFDHWDGSFDGNPQGVGTYVYVMTGSYNGNEFKDKGNFTLLR